MIVFLLVIKLRLQHLLQRVGEQLLQCGLNIRHRLQIVVFGEGFYLVFVVLAGWSYGIDSRIQADLDQYAETLAGFNIIEAGYTLVMKLHKLTVESKLHSVEIN